MVDLSAVDHRAWPNRVGELDPLQETDPDAGAGRPLRNSLPLHVDRDDHLVTMGIDRDVIESPAGDSAKIVGFRVAAAVLDLELEMVSPAIDAPRASTVWPEPRRIPLRPIGAANPRLGG